MRLNFLIGADRDDSKNVSLGRDESTGGKAKASHSTEALKRSYMHSYDPFGEWADPKAPRATANPDVSGYTNVACKSAPRNTNSGTESLSGAMAELGRKK